MAVAYIQQRKKQKYLMFAFLGVIIITLFVVWQGFFKEESPGEVLVLPPRPVQIPFELLKGDALESLRPFEEVSPLPEEELGRENPFVPF